ncbi:hypothetical protein CMV_027300 [Castanea mollissima]|uniref:Uncharacterized protein n=1 Tax=Castanea mollissima TaxID=60419 RepID=A0A8J4Q9Z6_9ROSI|nr:hypothetical protein CMV_027300 [Castanea mollissima]
MEYKENLKLVRLIDLSSNNLSGSIPAEISDLSELRFLNLSRNHLMGKIPEKIGSMKELESVDLSRNHLSGEIPPSMSNLTFLSLLDLSYNNLSGRIPSSTQLQSFDALRYIGNPQLCGDPLPKSCTIEEQSLNKSPIGSVEDDSKNSSFYIGMGVGFATGFWAICGALFFNRTWRHAYFRFADEIKDWIYVTTMIKMNLLEKLRVCLSCENSCIPRQLQIEANINKLFLYTRDADEAKAKEFNEMVCKASLVDQQKQLQENIHAQIKSFFMCINEILLPYTKRIVEAQELPPQPIATPCLSGLGFDIGRNGQPTDCPGPWLEVYWRLKDLIVYKLDGEILHKEASQDLNIQLQLFGKDADEADAEEIIEWLVKFLQENVHAQIKSFSMTMDEILIPDTKRIGDTHEMPQQPIAASHWSGLGFAIRRNGQPTDRTVVPETKPLNCAELSERLQDLIVTSLISSHLKCHTRVDVQNTYKITRYDGTVINAQHWGFGGY